MLALHPDRFCVGSEKGKADTGGSNCQIRQFENAEQFSHDFPFFLAPSIVADGVEDSIVCEWMRTDADGRLLPAELGAELIKPALTSAADGLICCHNDAFKSEQIRDWFECNGKLNRRAIRVGDNALVLKGAMTVHLGYDKRRGRIGTPGTGVINDGGTCSSKEWCVLQAHRRTGGKKHHIIPDLNSRWGEFVHGYCLAVPLQCGPCRARRCVEPKLSNRECAFGKDV